MNKKISWVLAISILTSACAGMEGMHRVVEKLPPLKDTGQCVPAPQITVTAQQANYSVVPPHFCADAGTEITVRFIGNKPAGTVILGAKPFIEATWLTASNPGGSGTQEATIKVPEDAGAPGDDRIDYPYSVTFVGELIIDPMISVD